MATGIFFGAILGGIHFDQDGCAECDFYGAVFGGTVGGAVGLFVGLSVPGP